MTGWSVTLVRKCCGPSVHGLVAGRPEWVAALYMLQCSSEVLPSVQSVWDLGLYIAGTAPNAKDVNVIDSFSFVD